MICGLLKDYLKIKDIVRVTYHINTAVDFFLFFIFLPCFMRSTIHMYIHIIKLDLAK